MTAHHPPEEHLLHYAAGALPQGAALVVASHLTYCPACRVSLKEAEFVGGAMLENEPAAPLSIGPGRLTLDIPETKSPALAARTVDVPAPLRPYIGDRFDDAPWRTFWPGMQMLQIAAPEDPSDIRLLRIRAGRGLPLHTHAGEELTLCLQGSFTEETGHYAVGDVATADGSVKHQQMADAGPDCICLTVFDGPMKFSSLWARIAALWVLR